MKNLFNKRRICLCFLIAMVGFLPAQVNLNSALHICYPFDGNANDFSGLSNNGTILGAIAASDRLGNPTGALQFDGVNDCVKINNTLPDMSRFSISVWIYQTGSYSNILCDATPDSFVDLVFNIGNNYMYLVADKPGGNLNNIVNNTGNLSNAWHHVVWVCDSVSQKVYVDTIQVANLNTTGTNIGYHNITASIGRDGDDPGDIGYVNYFQGKMDEYRIYRRAINYQEVRALYHGASCNTTVDMTAEQSVNSAFYSIYPNPTTGLFTIESENEGLLSMRDICGRTVAEFKLNSGKNQISAENLPKGIYFAYLTLNGKQKVTKLVIN